MGIEFVQIIFEFFSILRCKEVFETFSNYFFVGITEGFKPGIININEISIFVQGVIAQWSLLEKDLESVFSFMKCSFCPDSLDFFGNMGSNRFYGRHIMNFLSFWHQNGNSTK